MANVDGSWNTVTKSPMGDQQAVLTVQSAGDTFTGPAIVEEFGSTIPVHPGFEVVVDDWANLVIRKESAR